MNQQRFDVLLDSINRLARRGAVSHALNILEKLRPVEVAAVLRALSQREREATFAALVRRDMAKAAEALTELGPEHAVQLLSPLDGALATRLMASISSDDAALLVAELPVELRDRLLEQMHDDQSTDVQELLTFENETAGRIMTPAFFALQEDVTVSDAIAALQRRSEEFELSYYLYVVDERNHLVGVVSMRQLLMSTPSTPLKKIMSTDVIKVTTSTDQEDVARLVANYNLIALPVVDDENKLVGIVTVDDIIDVIREEATEDIYALAGVEADDRALGSSFNSVRRRLPWLLTSLATSLLAAAVVSLFRDTLEEAIALAVLLPVIMAMGMNAATQTMTVIVRGIGLNEVSWDRWLGVLGKEALVGLANGAVVGAAAGLAAAVWFSSARLGLAVGVALFVNTVVAGALGTVIPIVLKRLRVDPAVASNVFVMTLTVVVGLLIYLELGRMVLGR
jgi:magnesium transporter